MSENVVCTTIIAAFFIVHLENWFSRKFWAWLEMVTTATLKSNVWCPLPNSENHNPLEKFLSVPKI